MVWFDKIIRGTAVPNVSKVRLNIEDCSTLKISMKITSLGGCSKWEEWRWSCINATFVVRSRSTFKKIDRKEYDICEECWSDLQARLQGKGRDKERREIILLPPPREPDEPEEKPEPGEPPIIRGSSDRPN